MTDESIFAAASRFFAERQPFAMCTIVAQAGSTPRHLGSKMLVTPDGRIIGSVGGGELEHRVIISAQESLNAGTSMTLSYKLDDLDKGDPGVCGGQVEIFVEPIKLPTQILVIGGGHVGKALVYLAKWLGYYVILSDDRPDYCSPESVPNADQYIQCSLAEIPEKVRIDQSTYIILTTRGVKIDVPGLPKLFATDPAFIGIIGSKRRWITTRKELLSNGAKVEDLDRINSPIGLNIGAESPEEIAVSIMAEVMMREKKSSGESMRLNVK